MLYQNWNNGNWDNSQQWISTFDTRNNETTQTTQVWDAGAWKNQYKTTYTYNASDDVATELHQEWTVNTWVNYKQDTYTYDANRNVTRDTEKTWLNNSWVLSDLMLGTYDSNNYPMTESDKSYDQDGITVSSGDSVRYYYRPGTDVQSLSRERFNVYPNPNKGKFTVSCSEKIDGLEIFNSTGEIIFSTLKADDRKKSIDLSNYSKGIYVIRINSGNKLLTKKIILQ